jgi:hypothetical protein
MFNEWREWEPDEDFPVIMSSLSALLLLIVAPSAEEEPSTAPRSGLVVRKQMVVRSMRIGQGIPHRKALVSWRETRGVKCVKANAIVGASLIGQNSVDLVLKNRTRIRAKLDATCPALDYYYGFYLTPGSDGLVCANREILRSRMGRQCGIDRMRLLKQAKRR